MDDPSGELGMSFVLRYRRKEGQGRNKAGASDTNDAYQNQLKTIGSFSNLADFWELYAFLKRPGEFDHLGDLTLFKDDIPPMWEDERNKHGGRLVFRTPKIAAAAYWERLAFAMLGRQFEEWDAINGVCANTRHNQSELEAVLVIWTATSESEVIDSITRDMNRLFELPPRRRIAFKSHRKYYGKSRPAASSGAPTPSADASDAVAPLADSHQ
ncbi:eukaryotic translation initiation factor 4E member 2 [Thecamonas trahens ATCC 50062]|uniref:Eukaryotic translation initiation factor 4E member 2 n=1 Tax=Thecamonas trahens ATCC 50062 TaxID=461836 RepID=A0A0L0DF43_THETB|nr:eukaryotic translation initiation factor 4E member 2 [Thecamonas trahens ATCC 50062]KNC50904.1 eukaryotic translation initiation factor 4E member 2 [Thecamonas trahens ATCC 50062]|eukprot:XP_013756607.1 eukaryotic translation initiation factor 4E member 2 [Thecamonas trahens ATCC 50062]